MNRLEDSAKQRLGQQSFIDRSVGPFHPFLDVLRVSRTDDAGGHVFVGDRELESELCDIDPFRCAMIGGQSGDPANVMSGFVPGWKL